jgi:2-oxoglutarate ferredoxin oxidoreductase subunit beta
MCDLVKGAGATFVARGTAYHATMLEHLMAKGLEHLGFSFIESIAQCPIGFGRRNNQKTPVAMLNWQKDHAITIAAAAKASPEQLAGKFLIGEFVNKEAPEFSDVYWEMSRKAQLQQKEAE